LLGVALMSGAACCFAVMDSTVRWVAPLFGLTLVIWLRYTVQALIMAAWIAAKPAKTFATRNLRFQIARGALLLTSSSLAFAALRHMPVAEFTAIVLLTPMAYTLLSRLAWGTAVSALRWALVAGGFAGALLVVQPGFDAAHSLGWVALLPLAAAFSNASFQLLTTHYSQHEDPHTTNFYTGVVGAAAATPFVLAFAAGHAQALAAHMPQAPLLLLIAALGTVGHLLLIQALGQARPATLMPFQYVQIPAATLAGFMIFGDAPNAVAWLGMGLIAACGAASAWLNVKELREATPVGD
jgi:drug/metabolite transporter (DMT)-like permease